MKIKFRIYFLLPLLWTFFVSAENKFTHLTIKDGLSQSTIKCIFQDSKGFLWFGTSDGVNRFDGYEFIPFNNNPNDPNSISGNDVSCVYENPIDSVLWIGTQDGGLNYYDRKQNRFVLFKTALSKDQNWTLNDIRNLTSSKDNKLWISTYGEGFFSFSFNDSLLKQPEFCKLPIFRNINDLEIDDTNNIWIASTTGLYYWSLENQIKKTAPEKIELLPDIKQINVRSIKFDFKGNLWVGTNDRGLFKYHPVSKELANYTFSVSPNSLPSNTIRTIFQTGNSTIWIGTTNGLCKYLPESDNFEIFRNISSNPESLNNNIVFSILEDRSGILWIGTYLGGVNILDPMQTKFPKFNNILDYKSKYVIHNNVGPICIDERDKIWIGTSNGLIEIDKKNLYSNIKEGKLHFGGNTISGLVFNPHTGIFASTFEGIYLKRQKKDFVNITSEIEKQTGKSTLTFNSAIVDNDQIIWFSVPGGILKYVSEKEKFRLIKPKGPDGAEMEINSVSIIEDYTGKIWLGTFDGKLFTFDKHTEEFEQKLILKNQNLISFNKIFSLCESTPGNIWIGSNRGLYHLNSETDKIVRFLDVDGLSNNIVYAVVPDEAGKIWCSTNKGISCYNPLTKKFQNYTDKDGLQSNEFNQGAYFKDPQGIIYMGGIGGLNIFNPENIKLNNFLPPVVITKMQLQYNTITPESNPEILNHDISESKFIKLNYKQNTFSFEFTALSFSLSERNQYQYSLSLKGESKQWINSEKRRFATFTNVKPGEYIFKVKGSNSDGLWNESPTTIIIKITPPFWLTWWFRVLAIILAGLLIYLVFYFRVKSIKDQKKLLEKRVAAKTIQLLNHKEQIETQNKELKKINEKTLTQNENFKQTNKILNKQHEQISKQRDDLIQMAQLMEENNQAKLRFFTSISHELRTPLTLIINPLKEMVEHIENLSAKELQRKFSIVYGNASKLLLIVNELLDFRKVEINKMKMKVSQFDLVPFIQKTAFLFNDLATRGKYNFVFNSSHEKINVWADKEKIEKVIFNLLSNAFKYTPDKGEINISLAILKSKKTGNTAKITIKDNGEGIDKEKIPFIFERFYQLEQSGNPSISGSGLGLAIAKKYVELHNGEILVESTKGLGSMFTIELPTDKNHFGDNVKFEETKLSDKELLISSIGDYSPVSFNSVDTSEDRKKPLLLFVEDDKNLRLYLKDILSQTYRVVETNNAEEGIKLTKSKHPELIISDVMLAGMNGIDFCRNIKNEFSTSHIPFILLTALTNNQSKINSLKAGAEAYISKPFDLQHFILTIENIIEGRRRLFKKFEGSDTLNYFETRSDSSDQLFLTSATKCVENNLDNAAFNVDQFCHELKLSQPQVYRKIKALTNLNISEFIRNIRMKKAAQLLRTGKFKINEVAYETGFNDPNYFTKSFTKLFGMTPSDYSKL